MSKLDNLIDEFARSVFLAGQFPIKEEFHKQCMIRKIANISNEEFKQQILDYFMELVGEDVEFNPYLSDLIHTQKLASYGYNHAKQEIRDKIKEILSTVSNKGGKYVENKAK